MADRMTRLAGPSNTGYARPGARAASVEALNRKLQGLEQQYPNKSRQELMAQMLRGY
jgi:hypothetical protein